MSAKHLLLANPCSLASYDRKRACAGNVIRTIMMDPNFATFGAFDEEDSGDRHRAYLTLANDQMIGDYVGLASTMLAESVVGGNRYSLGTAKGHESCVWLSRKTQSYAGGAR